MTESSFDRNDRLAHPPIEGGRVSLRMLVTIRWIAVVGQTITLLIVHFLLGFPLPISLALGVVAASALINIANSLQQPGSVRLNDRDAVMYLAYDVVQVAALLYLTGGLQNPFALLLVAPVTVGASILSRGATALLAGMSVSAITVLAVWHLPLPWDEDMLNLPSLYILAVWLSLSLATLFLAAYIWNVAEEGRRMSDAFAATQMSLAREQRVSAVGALAAAAAHELGSPLGTIAVVAKELARDLPPGSPYAEDAQLLLSETARCRTILAALSKQRDADGGAPFETLPISVLVEAAGEPHMRSDTAIVFDTDGDPISQPSIIRSPEIMHGLGNFIQNALQFAEHQVEVMTSWDGNVVQIEIADDGPGFPSHVLARLGEPYLSGRSDADGEHMGLGIFIAQTLLQRTGATVEFANGPTGGAVVRAIWSRRSLKIPDASPRPIPLFEESIV